MKNIWEYSKKKIDMMLKLWFVGAGFGAAVVIVELVMAFIAGSPYVSTMIHLPELLSYIGMPVSGAIVGYLAKSAFENREKIKQNPDYRDEFGGDKP